MCSSLYDVVSEAESKAHFRDNATSIRTQSLLCRIRPKRSIQPSPPPSDRKSRRFLVRSDRRRKYAGQQHVESYRKEATQLVHIVQGPSVNSATSAQLPSHTLSRTAKYTVGMTTSTGTTSVEHSTCGRERSNLAAVQTTAVA